MITSKDKIIIYNTQNDLGQAVVVFAEEHFNEKHYTFDGEVIKQRYTIIDDCSIPDVVIGDRECYEFITVEKEEKMIIKYKIEKVDSSVVQKVIDEASAERKAQELAKKKEEEYKARMAIFETISEELVEHIANEMLKNVK